MVIDLNFDNENTTMVIVEKDENETNIVFAEQIGIAV